MEKNYDVYRVGHCGRIEINRVKEREIDGYITGASKELVDAMLCEVKWEVKKLELEIKKVILFLENEHGEECRREDELKMELLREQALCREFIKGVDRVLIQIREMYNEGSHSNQREDMLKRLESLKLEKDFLRDVLIKQMSTYSILRSLHHERRISMIASINNHLSGDSNPSNSINSRRCAEIEEDVMSYFDVFPPKSANHGYESSSRASLSRIPKHAY
ncbi:hypothetical protein OIY81_2601 [Cryptosporidium canis]|uniref:Uncharacterized protein n=1 Tax=Cryptosporidium canis TaxID=195482 RepID=A0ABQ8PDT8_9CRYT|nr:hypothetical protein OIY81_2601 [Cryptosporidium canis]KAJ1615387.1 hypothetical protein OJ252_172 [Cryptosporidium canis]